MDTTTRTRVRVSELATLSVDTSNRYFPLTAGSKKFQEKDNENTKSPCEGIEDGEISTQENPQEKQETPTQEEAQEVPG